MRNRILTLLNIRQEEAQIVQQLFFLQLFQGIGVAMFTSVTWALFLKTFHAEGLPFGYLCTAVLLWGVGYGYNKFEHRIPLKTFIPGVILSLSLGVALCAIPFLFTHRQELVFVMLCLSYAVYLVSNLEFWGLAALLFDTRQSKRLFGIIGAGDVIAKLVGYSVVPLLAAVFNTETMLLFSSVMIALSVAFFHVLRKSGTVNISLRHEHHPHPHQHESIRKVVAGLFSDRLIMVLAVLSFTVTTCIALIGFAFYSEIKTEAKTDVQLAAFIALFFAIGRTAALIVRLVITSRFASRFGMKGTLLLSPLVMLAVLAGILALPLVSEEMKPMFYAFGGMMIVSEVLKYAVQDPVFLTLMQPLSAAMRLRGHTIVKGITDPFAMAFSGLLLYCILHLTRFSALMVIGYVLLGLLGIWIVLIFITDREYHRSLLKALHKRYAVGNELDLNDARTHRVLADKAREGQPGEALHALNLAEKYRTDATADIIGNGFLHPDTGVRRYAVTLTEQLRITALIPKVEEIVKEPDNPLYALAVRVLCTLSPKQASNAHHFLSSLNGHVVKAAVIGVLRSSDVAVTEIAEKTLQRLVLSSEVQDRIVAAEIIGELGVSRYSQMLGSLLLDNDARVVTTAITAAGKVGDHELLRHVMNSYATGMHERIALQALRNAGDHAMPHIRYHICSGDLNRKKKAALINMCGLLGTDAAQETLDEALWTLPDLRSDTLSSLHNSRYVAPPNRRNEYLNLITEQLTNAARIVFMIQNLSRQQGMDRCIEALHLELDALRECLLMSFAFVYDAEQMIKARTGFLANNKDSIANALEIIERILPKEVSSLFCAVYEPNSIEGKCALLAGKVQQPLGLPEIAEEIFGSANHLYHRWTKATLLYSLRGREWDILNVWSPAYLDSRDVLLHETAHYAMN